MAEIIANVNVTMSFWTDYKIRCADCGRDMNLCDAREDGWRNENGSIIAPITATTTSAIFVPVGLCWRCDRERRAKSIGML